MQECGSSIQTAIRSNRSPDLRAYSLLCGNLENLPNADSIDILEAARLRNRLRGDRVLSRNP